MIIRGGRITTDDRGRIQPRELTPKEKEEAVVSQVFAEHVYRTR